MKIKPNGTGMAALALALIAFPAAAQMGKGLSDFDLRGPVKSARLILVSSSGADPSLLEGAPPLASYEFDQAGRALSVSEPGQSVSYEYDGSGRLLKETQTEASSDSSSQPTVTVTSYDWSNPRFVDAVTVQGGKKAGSAEWALDASGRLLSGRRYTASGTPVSSTVLSYDSSGRLLSSVVRDGSGALIEEIDHERNAAGLAVLDRITEGEGSPTEYALSYDEAGELSQELFLDPDGKPVAGDRYEYEYDERGNWIEMRTASSDEGVEDKDFRPFSTVKREIEYY